MDAIATVIHNGVIYNVGDLVHLTYGEGEPVLRITALRAIIVTPDSPTAPLFAELVTADGGEWHPTVHVTELTHAVLIPLADATADDIAALVASATVVDDDYLARMAAGLGIEHTPAAAPAAPAAPVIEIGDTVRFIGKTHRWTVSGINTHKNEIEVDCDWGGFGRGQTWHYRSRTTNPGRIELVRKGNALDDKLAKLDADLAAVGITFD